MTQWQRPVNDYNPPLGLRYGISYSRFWSGYTIWNQNNPAFDLAGVEISQDFWKVFQTASLNLWLDDTSRHQVERRLHVGVCPSVAAQNVQLFANGVYRYKGKIGVKEANKNNSSCQTDCVRVIVSFGVLLQPEPT